MPPNAMETEVIHTKRKGKSILLYFPLILNYFVGSMYFPYKLLTPLRDVMLTVTRELGLLVIIDHVKWPFFVQRPGKGGAKRPAFALC